MSGKKSQPPKQESLGNGAIEQAVVKQLKEIEGKVKDRFPAANLVATLLRQIGANVALAPRHLHTVAQVVGRSKKVYEAIVNSMAKVEETSSEQLDNCWDLLERYTTAIPVLERYVSLKSISVFYYIMTMLRTESYWTSLTPPSLQTNNILSFLRPPARRRLSAFCTPGLQKGIN